MAAFVPTLRPVLKEPYYGNEYHFQDRKSFRPLEARLRDASFLQHIEVPVSINPREWVACSFTEEIKRILTPQDGRVAYVQFGSWNNWRPLTIIRPTGILNGHFITHILLYVVMRNNLVNNDLLCHNDNKHHPVSQNSVLHYSVLHNSISSVYLYKIFRESYTQTVY